MELRPNDYVGDTLINNDALIGGAVPVGANTLQMAVNRNNIMPHGAGKGNLILNGVSATVQAIYNLNGTNQIVNGLSSKGANQSNTFVQNALANTTSILTVGDNDATSTFAGVMRDNAGTGGILGPDKNRAAARSR